MQVPAPMPKEKRRQAEPCLRLVLVAAVVLGATPASALPVFSKLCAWVLGKAAPVETSDSVSPDTVPSYLRAAFGERAWVVAHDLENSPVRNELRTADPDALQRHFRRDLQESPGAKPVGDGGRAFTLYRPEKQPALAYSRRTFFDLFDATGRPGSWRVNLSGPDAVTAASALFADRVNASLADPTKLGRPIYELRQGLAKGYEAILLEPSASLERIGVRKVGSPELAYVVVRDPAHPDSFRVVLPTDFPVEVRRNDLRDTTTDGIVFVIEPLTRGHFPVLALAPLRNGDAEGTVAAIGTDPYRPSPEVEALEREYHQLLELRQRIAEHRSRGYLEDRPSIGLLPPERLDFLNKLVRGLPDRVGLKSRWREPVKPSPRTAERDYLLHRLTQLFRGVAASASAGAGTGAAFGFDHPDGGRHSTLALVSGASWLVFDTLLARVAAPIVADGIADYWARWGDLAAVDKELKARGAELGPRREKDLEDQRWARLTAPVTDRERFADPQGDGTPWRRYVPAWPESRAYLGAADPETLTGHEQTALFGALRRVEASGLDGAGRAKLFEAMRAKGSDYLGAAKLAEDAADGAFAKQPPVTAVPFPTGSEK